MTNFKNKLYTGGSEGVVRQWDLSQLTSGDAAFIMEKELHSDVIWDLNHHRSSNLMLSSGADGLIQLFRTDQKIELLSQFTRPSNSDHLLTPTSLDWLNNDRFVTGYVDLMEIVVFDVERVSLGFIIAISTFRLQVQLE